ncbi:ATP-dependent metallopeptidase Hfl [Fomitiporia mediterranea MF3/22]|uniref:ATP-dependent metallopeptidase Hfl n=1 Tax=Fomitiporia mediterranea (strain MF3/22) TaxID=694068 RepID=UPI0004407F30|nr:ATP-dependent metallopeptidase Hfl [Fomitiporia mediterranea MF3/22]EJD05932.1 ATP-dependent metallopeptidase Hfl [Fomitiporia mediterranea MF3/22]
MLGLGLRIARPLASPSSLFVATRWCPPSRTFLHLAAVTPRRSPCLNSSRLLQLISSSRTYPIRFASTSSSASFPTVHSVAAVTKAEVEADANPNDVAAQERLFRLLIESERPAGWNVLLSRWERMCEFNPGSPLLHSDEAFQYYLMALVKSGHNASVTPAVSRREQLLRTHPLPTELQQDDTATLNAGQQLTQPVTTTESLVASTSATSGAHLLSSRSQEIAKRVLATEAAQLLSTAKKGSAQMSASSALKSAPLSTNNSGGGPESPIYVTIAETKGEMWRKIAKTVVWAVVGGFFILVVFSLFLENTNLLKTGPRAAEFEPMKGKTVKFSDVHGVDEAKEELKDVVDFLKDPAAFSTLGGKLPKGILLTGSPGTGKTMLARAVAGEAGVPFLFASGSEFEEIFVGVGAKRVRELFATARKKQPAIIFIDELDAIGGKRSNREQQHLKQTLNQLLVEMDGFLQSEGVIVIAATNFPESLDQALIRPGRFDRTIAVPLPDVRGRVQILQHFMKGVIAAPEVDTMIIARGTPGFSGAELQNMVNQAAIQASKEGAKEVTLKHFEWAKDRIIMGAERRTHYIDPKDKKCTAYHEGGHALVALYTEGAMPLHKVTCVTRGHALGLTQFLPEGDKVSMTMKEYQASIDVSMGGRVAEELIYGTENISSGASSDIRNATRTASAMVRQFGFSDKIGPVFHHENDNTISPQKRELIESEIQRMIVEGQDRARRLLKDKEEELHRLANALFEYETLDLQEVKKVIKGEPIRPVEEKLLEVIKQSSEESDSNSTTPVPEPTPQPIATVS